MFLGEYTHKIDEKNRLAIPAKFRADLKQGAIVTKGLDGCLFVYTKAEWQKLVEKISALPLTQSKARTFARMMLMGAMEVSLDKLGRILLPDYLKKFAALKKQVTIGGVYNRLEIWDANRWQAYRNRTEKNVEKTVEELFGAGI